MPRSITCTSTRITLLLVLLDCPSVSSATVNINNTDGGWYSVQGIHDPTNSNYLVGDNRIGNCTPDVACQDDFRNFFVFNLASVSQPIASAKFAVFVPSPPDGYRSLDPSENYELHDVTTSIATLVAGTGGVAAHIDLGTGVVYGSRLMTAGDMGKTVEITLNLSAVAAMNSTHGLFAIGGSIMTLDPSITVQGEEVFGASGGTGSSNVGLAQLRLTVVPEPSTIVLLSISAISLLGYRKRDS
jgi:hypothetical protein